MALSQIINYDTPGSFTFDSAKVEFVGSLAQLKLIYSPIEDFSEDFADDTGFTYDNTKAQFTGGLVQQKDQTATNSVAASLLTTKDLTWHKAGESTVGTLNGAPSFVGGKMVCTGSQGVYWVRPSQAIETIKFRYTPNYTTSPPANVNLCNIYNGINNNDRLTITNSPSGNNIRAAIYNSTGTVVVATATVVGGWAPTAGVEYEFEVVIDSTAGTLRVFIDGVSIGTLSPGAWTRGGVSTRYYLGASPQAYNRAEGSFDDYILFSDAQHTTGYTPGYTIAPFIYAESSLTLPTFTYSGPGLLRPAGAPTSTESGTPRYLIQGKYWDGAAWSDSDETYAQASSKADIIANIATFPSTGASSIVVKLLFGDSNTISSVDQIDFPVQGQLYPTDNPTILVNAAIETDLLEALTEDAAYSGSDLVRYAINAAGQDKYWDGAAWSNSSSYAESNVVADVTANLASLALGTGQAVKLKVYLHSENGETTPTITQNTIDYDFAPATPAPCQVCIVYGYLRKPPCLDSTDAKLRITNKSLFFYDGQVGIQPWVAVVDANADGEFEVELIETQTDAHTYQFEILYINEESGTTLEVALLGDVEVPNQLSVNLADLFPTI